jgi:hypothetical protein
MDYDFGCAPLLSEPALTPFSADPASMLFTSGFRHTNLDTGDSSELQHKPHFS